MQASELGPRLIAHNENQIDYYERQREQAEKDLARLSIIYSGQLQFDFTELGSALEAGDGE